jgi:hypothetical protein
MLICTVLVLLLLLWHLERRVARYLHHGTPAW